MVQRVYYGPITNPKNAALPDLTIREWFAAAPLVAAAIVMGMVPSVFLRPMEPAVTRLTQQIGHVHRVAAPLPAARATGILAVSARPAEQK
jgi:NADH:ubiquinone oxidoreductase subunit 4 (subunit M)